MDEKCFMKIDDICVLILGGSRFRDSRIKAVRETWLANFNNYFISCDAPLDKDLNRAVGVTGDFIFTTDHSDCHSCPPKIFRGLEHVVANANDCPWLFIGDDDTFVNTVNLIAFTKMLEVTDDKMYGKDMTGNYPYNGGQIKYLSGGGGTLMPMHVAKKMIKRAKEEDWFEWLCLPRQIPPKHAKDYPTAAGADTKLGWLGNQLKITQVSYPHLFYPESYKKYKHDPSNILQCITYHRQYGNAQRELNEIVFKDISKNKLSLEPPAPKKVIERAAVQNIEKGFGTSYYINTELLLLRKKIERLEKQLNNK